ncbi:M23 family metallopeptidase [Candidatus Woesearchaeota archaeon]|nr:M23 family metallopeptidase [Candidatus Woesearchaeota archaeon]
MGDRLSAIKQNVSTKFSKAYSKVQQKASAFKDKASELKDKFSGNRGQGGNEQKIKLQTAGGGFAAGMGTALLGRMFSGSAKDSEVGKMWFWFALLVKHILIDGYYASLSGYGWYGAGWYENDTRSWFFSFIFFLAYWLLYMNNLKEKDEGFGFYAKTTVLSTMIFLLDNQVPQRMLAEMVAGNPTLATFFGPVYLYRFLFPWWAILVMYSSQNRFVQKARVIHAFLIVGVILLTMFNSDVPAAMSKWAGNIPGTLQDAESQSETKAGLTGWFKINYKRLRECIDTQNETACKLLGRPVSDAKKTAPTETTILQGGVDDKLSQDMILKLSASKNAAVNYWEKDIIASASLEAVAFNRDFDIGLVCGLVENNVYDNKSGEMNPNKVTVKYTNVIGTVELLTCKILKPYDLKKGVNSVYFRANVDNQLTLDSYIIAYFTREEDLNLEVDNYLSSKSALKEQFIATRASKGVAAAQREVYANLYKDLLSTDYPSGKVESKSEVSFIKAVVTMGDVPIIGIKPADQKTLINLQIAIENMVKGGKIKTVRNGALELPPWLTPVEGSCSILRDPITAGDGNSIYRLNENILKGIDWGTVKYGALEQKKLAPCTLEFTGDRNDENVLYNPSTLNPRVIYLKVGYDYEMEATGTLSVTPGDLSKSGIFYPPTEILTEKPVPSASPYNISDTFGLPGVGGRPREGVTIYAYPTARVNSATSGIVVQKGCTDWGGNFVRIRHESQYEFTYAHLNKTEVKVNDVVTAGQHIGEVGNTAGCIAKNPDGTTCDDLATDCGIPLKSLRYQLHFGIYDYSGGAPLKPYCALKKLYDSGYVC